MNLLIQLSFQGNRVSTLKVIAVRSLVQFQRITLKAGESRRVELILASDAFATYNAEGKKSVATGQFEIAVGGGQPGVKVGNYITPGVKVMIGTPAIERVANRLVRDLESIYKTFT